MADHADDASQYMTCMEVWGGNQPADHAVSMPGLDAWVFCRPFDQAEAGGDVYYVSACATGRITRLLLADVSGHGKHVADTASALRRLMQKYVNYIDQSAFVRSMNQRFSELSSGGMFATAIVSTFFAPTNDLTLCIAGHPPPMRYRSKCREWVILSADESQDDSGNIPLGIDAVADWTQFEVTLDVGDLVLCYTDSLIESRDPNGQMLGVAGLLKLLNQIPIGDPKDAVQNIMKAIGHRCGDSPDADDVTLLLFRPNGSAPAAVPISLKFRAPWRILKSAFQSLGGRRPASWPEISLSNIGGAIFKSLNPRRGKLTSATNEVKNS